MISPPTGNEIHAQLDHPVIDADGHYLQHMPLVRELLAEVGGGSIVDRFDSYGPRGGHLSARAFWGLPAEATRDRMTATLPALLYERMDELGLDFAVMYPTPGMYMTEPDPEVRRATFRAFNLYAAETFRGFEDRLAPVAIIPTFTPEEAVEELDFAIGTLGLKAIRLEGTIPRNQRVDGSAASWVDTLGHESMYDYDPVWAKCAELGVVPTFHGVGFGWGSRTSSSNYVYNHVGCFSSAQEAVCRSLVLGGVTRRFPQLHFAFLEGGVAWAAELYVGLLGHFEKRNRDQIGSYDPARIDVELATDLFSRYAGGRLAPFSETFGDEVRALVSEPRPGSVDDFAESGLETIADIEAMFSDQLYFGCEADDPLNPLAFDHELLPGGIGLRTLFSSDIGHWDVPDMREVLHEAWETVEHGQLSLDQFRDFTFGNVARMFTGVNPEFFRGTVVETAVDAFIRSHEGTSTTHGR